MARLYLRYKFAICTHAITKRSSHKLNSFLLRPLWQLASRKFLKRKLEFMISNIREAIPGKERCDYDQIIKNSVEVMWQILLRNLSRRNQKSHPRIVKNESVIDSIVSGTPKGAIIITSHQGDWEDLIQYFRERDDLDTCNLYRKPKCKKMVGYLRKFRGVDQYCSGYGLIKRFKNASSRKVFALIGVDQRPLNKGISVDFLNRPTEVSPISVQIALRFQLPIVIAQTLIKNGQTEISFREIDILNTAYSSKENAEHYALQKVMFEVNRNILENPEQWLMWSHNFWKPINKIENVSEEVYPLHEELFVKKENIA